MKAAILVDQKKPLEIAELYMPNKLDYGQVKVKVYYSGICGSQIGEIDGVKGPDRYLPHLLGHEGGAIVEEIGPGVKKVQPGDHVVLHWRPGSGIEAPTPTYMWNGKKVNAGWVTTFNEQAVISENRLTPIAKDIDLEIAALYGCAITTGYGVIYNDAKLQAGQSVVIYGAGGIGLSEIMAAKLGSAYPIVAIDIHPHKLDAAYKFGATHTIHSTNQDPQEALSELLPQGADIVIDNTGVRSVREQAYQVAGKVGRVVLVGVPHTAGETMSIDSLQLHFSKHICGSHGGDINPNVHIPRLLNLQNAGYFDPREMISHQFGLDDINTAIDKMRSGEVIRCSIRMNHS